MSPTYKNVLMTRQQFQNKVVEPNQEVCSFVYYNEKDTGLLQVSEKPFHNPIILSEKVVKNGTIFIPRKDNLGKSVDKYALHFCLESGEVDLFFNSVENKPSLKLYKGCKWNIRCFERQIDKLIAQSNKDFILWIIIEKIV